MLNLFMLNICVCMLIRFDCFYNHVTKVTFNVFFGCKLSSPCQPLQINHKNNILISLMQSASAFNPSKICMLISAGRKMLADYLYCTLNKKPIQAIQILMKISNVKLL